jgi:hypothetical protein
MKKLLIVFSFLLGLHPLFSQSLSTPRIGIGFQGSFPAMGLSVKADLTEHHSLQGVAGFFTNQLKTYAVKYMFCFNESGDFFVIKPYFYGTAGVFKYDLYFTSETVFGFGAGAGLEYYIPVLSEKLRPAFEIGLTRANFNVYQFKSLTFGVGLHYYFEL